MLLIYTPNTEYKSWMERERERAAPSLSLFQISDQTEVKEAALIKSEPYFCDCISYLSPKMFSETYFGALFSFKREVFMNRKWNIFSCIVKREAEKNTDWTVKLGSSDQSWSTILSVNALSKLFSEPYFSALFSCNMRLFVTSRPPILFRAKIKRHATHITQARAFIGPVQCS